MAYEQASGENLDEGQKEAAMEELVTTGEIADSVGQEKDNGSDKEREDRSAGSGPDR